MREARRGEGKINYKDIIGKKKERKRRPTLKRQMERTRKGGEGERQQGKKGSTHTMSSTYNHQPTK